jgi:protein phosphatase
MFRKLFRILGLAKCRTAATDAASASERGLVRRENQDNLLVNREAGVFCVADGMGGGEGGAKASEIVCATIAASTAAVADMQGRVRQVTEAVENANSEIQAYAERAGYRQMATTVAALVFDPAGRREAALGYVGDSRLYRLRSGGLEQLSHDHTIAAELMRRKTGDADAEASASRAGKLSHVLTRAVGIEPDVQMEWTMVDVRPGDRFLLCTDGLYDMVSGSGIRRAMASGGKCTAVVEKLREMVFARGAIDNFTIIAIDARG